MPVWTKPAKDDLRSQLTYVAKDDPEAAKGLAVRIKAACAALEQFPRIGRAGALDHTRELIIPDTPYICVYREAHGRVEILRLLHAKMMWPR